MLSRPENGFSAEERRAMLALARAAIVGAFTSSSPAISGVEPACFSMRRGLFVTVQVAGKLRGCIGVIEARETLRESIIHCAESAAFHDLRFSSLQPEEVRDLRIEISVLSELTPISPDSVEIGRPHVFERNALIVDFVGLQTLLPSGRGGEPAALCRATGYPLRPKSCQHRPGCDACGPRA